MTGYHISIGYLSANDKQYAWERLKQIIAEICSDPKPIIDEARRLGMSDQTAEMYAESYKTFQVDAGRTEDSTLVIKERDPDNEDSYPQVMQFASGGGESRHVKEAMRRAVCRVVMNRMHRLGLEVNINVA